MSFLSCDFQKYLSFRDRIKATERNNSFCDSQTLISPFWAKYAPSSSYRRITCSCSNYPGHIGGFANGGWFVPVVDKGEFLDAPCVLHWCGHLFPRNLTQIWSQMIDAHHIFNSSIVVYLYVVSPMFCLHNRAFKEQEVARQKLLSGGGKHMKCCRERRSEVNLCNLWRNHLGGLNCKWENIERWWFKALSKHFYNTEQSPKETWKQSWLDIYIV